ncbi:MAG: TRAP transporter substrate-binding protein DctP [Gammaproteobacteria bacterium]|nr:TRAP transporter substrate-binding protein DctP [Gammaproteobacteria bacterium]
MILLKVSGRSEALRSLAALACAMLLSISVAQAQTILRAAHQWPGGIGDVRDEMIQIIAREVNAADVDLLVRVYPGQSLVKAADQWSAVVGGHLDLTALPLDYASGRHPEFSATLMPGLVKNHDHARRLSDSPFMASIKQIIDEAGAIVLADAWLAGGFSSTQRCILWPQDIEGQVIRAAGPAFERMLVGAGASISSMPSSEIYTALQTGVLDAANTSSASFVSYRIYEHTRCLTGPGDNALWFMYEPVLISKRRWGRLDEAQRAAFVAAAQVAEDYFFEQAKRIDGDMERRFRDAGVEIAHMTAEQAQAWRDIAATTSYKTFADEVDGGAELIRQALAVD